MLVEIAIRAGQARTPNVTGAPPAGPSPYARAAEALRRHMREEPERCASAIARFVALMYLFTGDRLRAWVRPSADCRRAHDIHPAVVHVAAEMALNRKGRFPERKFLAAVAETADRVYAGGDALRRDSSR